MKEISLGKKYKTSVDDEDYPDLIKHSWYAYISKASSTIYAYRFGKLGEPATVTMHRQIMDFPKDIMIDHINGNGIDNRRSNLRFATYSQNLANMRSVAPSTSRFKGVYWDKKANAWGSTIQHEKERIFIGYFNDEYAAALAYDAHARELFKEYAYLNDPDNCIEICDIHNLIRGSDPEKRPDTKLSYQKVQMIRRMYLEGNNQTIIANEFEIDRSQISRIVNNKAWKIKQTQSLELILNM